MTTAAPYIVKKTTGDVNTGTDSIKLYGKCYLSISGTWEGVVQLQRSWDGGTTWLQVGSNYTSNSESMLDLPENPVTAPLYRLQFTTDTSGTVVLLLSR